jgi:hypothetical protein
MQSSWQLLLLLLGRAAPPLPPPPLPLQQQQLEPQALWQVQPQVVPQVAVAVLLVTLSWVLPMPTLPPCNSTCMSPGRAL